MPKKNRKSRKRKAAEPTEAIAPVVNEGPVDPVSDSPNRHLWQDDPTSFGLLVVCVISQLTTLAITWPVWLVREFPVNLSWIANTPQLPMGIPLVVSLLMVLVAPRKFGMLLHLGVLLVAITMDQFRCQPQVLSITVLMMACVWKPIRQLCVWYLISMWLWTGVHKVLSPDWFGYSSVDLLKRLQWLHPYEYNVHFAVVVAASEIGLGVLAFLRPRIAAIFCVAMHLGIAIFLFKINWNFSVLPWNVCTAIVGGWLLRNAVTSTSKLVQRPSPKWQMAILAAMMIVPTGFYFGLVRHCFAHVLYSDYLPIAVITRGPDEVELLDGWDEFAVPFPHEKAAYVAYLKASGKPGEKLHVLEPRKLARGGYFVLRANRQVKEINEQTFFASDQNSTAGFGVDDPSAILSLELAGVRMRKRERKAMIFAAIFDAEKFTPELLDSLPGLPNLEEIQFQDCQIRDEDLKKLLKLRKLTRIGFDNTAVTPKGLKQLKELESLELIQYRGSVFEDVDQIPAG